MLAVRFACIRRLRSISYSSKNTIVTPRINLFEKRAFFFFPLRSTDRETWDKKDRDICTAVHHFRLSGTNRPRSPFSTADSCVRAAHFCYEGDNSFAEDHSEAIHMAIFGSEVTSKFSCAFRFWFNSKFLMIVRLHFIQTEATCNVSDSEWFPAQHDTRPRDDIQESMLSQSVDGKRNCTLSSRLMVIFDIPIEPSIDLLIIYSE